MKPVVWVMRCWPKDLFSIYVCACIVEMSRVISCYDTFL